MMLGRDETQPGAWYTQFFNETDFDRATDAIIQRLHDIHSWDLFNPTLWKLIGVTGSPVKQFLSRYINIARQWEDHYTSDFPERWEAYFVNNYGYDPETIRQYLDALQYCYENKRGVTVDIYKPYNYEPSVEQGTLIPSPGKEVRNVAKYLVTVAVAGGIVYMLGKTLIQTGAKGMISGRRG